MVKINGDTNSIQFVPVTATHSYMYSNSSITSVYGYWELDFSGSYTWVLGIELQQ